MRRIPLWLMVIVAVVPTVLTGAAICHTVVKAKDYVFTAYPKR